MTVLEFARKYAKTAAKGTLYVVGGTALMYPVIKSAKVLWDGGTVEDAAAWGIYEGTGYSTTQNRVVPEQLRNTVVRDIVGVASIYAATKL